MLEGTLVDATLEEVCVEGIEGEGGENLDYSPPHGSAHADALKTDEGSLTVDIYGAACNGTDDEGKSGYGGQDGSVYIASDDVEIFHSVVQDGAKTGIVIEGASPLISATQILANNWGLSGAGFWIDNGNPTIVNNVIQDNIASQKGGVAETTTCVSTPAGCDVTDVADPEPAVESCEKLLAEICDTTIKCGAYEDEEECAAANSKLDCSKAVAVDPHFEMCLSGVEDWSCDEELPPSCTEVIILSK